MNLLRSKWKTDRYGKMPGQCIWCPILVCHVDNFTHKPGIVYNDETKIRQVKFKKFKNF